MSVSRSLTPYLILGVLALGVGLGATLGVSSAPRYTYFAEPSPGHPQVVSAFRKLVRHTLAQRSFTVHYNGFTLIYQAPDRTEFELSGPVLGGPSTIVIGRTTYIALGGSNGGVEQWNEYHTTKGAEELASPQAAKETLNELLSFSSVVLRSGSYVVKEVTPIGEFEPDHAGDVLLQATVRPVRGDVASVSILLFGVEPRTIASFVRYSGFDRSAVVAPPRSRIVSSLPDR
jgi:hypothetical protein